MNKIKEKHKNTPDGKYILKYQYTNILEDEKFTTEIEKLQINDNIGIIALIGLGALLALISVVVHI